MQKIKEGIFDNPQIRQLMQGLQFAGHMTEQQSIASTGFILVIKIILVNYEASNYVELVSNVLSSFKNLGCIMNIKVQNCIFIAI